MESKARNPERPGLRSLSRKLVQLSRAEEAIVRLAPFLNSESYATVVKAFYRATGETLCDVREMLKRLAGPDA